MGLKPLVFNDGLTLLNATLMPDDKINLITIFINVLKPQNEVIIYFLYYYLQIESSSLQFAKQIRMSSGKDWSEFIQPSLTQSVNLHSIHVNDSRT